MKTTVAQLLVTMSHNLCLVLQMLLPPKYEDIATGMDQSLHIAPPPPYTDVTAQPHLTSHMPDGSSN